MRSYVAEGSVTRPRARRSSIWMSVVLRSYAWATLERVFGWWARLGGERRRRREEVEEGGEVGWLDEPVWSGD